MEEKKCRTNKVRRTSDRRNLFNPGYKGKGRRKFTNRRGQEDKSNRPVDLNLDPFL